MVRLRLLSTVSVVEAAELVVATTFRSAVNVKAEANQVRRLRWTNLSCVRSLFLMTVLGLLLM